MPRMVVDWGQLQKDLTTTLQQKKPEMVPQIPAIMTKLKRSTQPEVVGFFKMLQQRASITLRLPMLDLDQMISQLREIFGKTSSQLVSQADGMVKTVASGQATADQLQIMIFRRLKVQWEPTRSYKDIVQPQTLSTEDAVKTRKFLGDTGRNIVSSASSTSSRTVISGSAYRSPLPTKSTTTSGKATLSGSDYQPTTQRSSGSGGTKTSSRTSTTSKSKGSSAKKDTKVSKICKKLYGKIQIVTSGKYDYKVRIVDNFEHMRVRKKKHARRQCEWDLVEKFTDNPKFRIKIVTAHEDIKVKYVSFHEGIQNAAYR